MFSLKYTHPKEGPMENLFTLNERATALAICRALFDKGQRPRLVERSYDNPCVRVLFDHKNVSKKRQPRKAA